MHALRIPMTLIPALTVILYEGDNMQPVTLTLASNQQNIKHSINMFLHNLNENQSQNIGLPSACAHTCVNTKLQTPTWIGMIS